VRDGAFYPDGPDDPPSHVFEVTPAVGFGFGKKMGFSGTGTRRMPTSMG
jgi:hypothetical protein